MKEILVTGAGGFIGSQLCETLVSKGYKVRAMVRYSSRGCWGWLDNSPCKKRIEVVSGDIRNYDSVKASIEGVDMVFHLAALIGIPYSYQTPESYVDTNVTGTLNLLQAARELKVKKVICVSTSEIYGTAQFIPISELHSVNPQSPYAASKAAADFMALSFYRSFGTPVTIIRPFNTYGPRQSARAIIPTIITQILGGSKSVRLGFVNSTRDFTFVNDTIEGFIKAGESTNSTGEVINIGSNSEIMIKDLVHLIAKLLGKKVSITTDDIRMRPVRSEVKRLKADISKAKKLLNWTPGYTLESGLHETIRWFRDPENLAKYKTEIYNV